MGSTFGRCCRTDSAAGPAAVGPDHPEPASGGDGGGVAAPGGGALDLTPQEYRKMLSDRDNELKQQKLINQQQEIELKQEKLINQQRGTELKQKDGELNAAGKEIQRQRTMITQLQARRSRWRFVKLGVIMECSTETTQSDISEVSLVDETRPMSETE